MMNETEKMPTVPEPIAVNTVCGVVSQVICCVAPPV
jgi:hypothetical protein